MKLSTMIASAALAATMMISGVASAAPTMATQNEFYGDAKFGYGIVYSTPRASGGLKRESIERDGTMWGVDAGYMFVQRAGVEFGYQDYDNVTYSGGKETNNKLYYLAAKGFMVISNGLDIYGKLGFARSYQTNPTGAEDAGKHDSSVPYVALGIQGALGDHMVWLVDLSWAPKKDKVAQKAAVAAGIGIK